MVGNPESSMPYIFECSNNRRKRLIQASSSLVKNSLFHLLPDGLVEEILCRLPCSKFVIRCQIVCKHWAALISHPVFASRFIATRSPNVPKSSYTSSPPLIQLNNGESSFVIVVRGVGSFSSKGLKIDLKDQWFDPSSFSITRLPFLVGENAFAVDLVAACNDLVLYRREESKRYDYYIGNFQTKKCILLPSLEFYHGQYDAEGFICDPFYSCDGNSIGTNEIYRYSIVVAHCCCKTASSTVMAQLFSSETRQWVKIVLSLPRPCRLFGKAFVFGGMIHFRGIEGLICVDPYQDALGLSSVIQCRLIAWPPGLFIGSACTGLRQGLLQVSSFNNSHLFLCWVLKNYESGEWSLLHKVERNQWICHFNGWLGMVIGLHPTDPDTFYVFNQKRVLLCNAMERTVKVASKVCPKALRIKGDLWFFNVMVPVWPTPLPNLGTNVFHTIAR